tara:strand:- start:2275 stop:2778 length:504 start_codon:yes stop_codon:yes gene_type:complete
MEFIMYRVTGYFKDKKVVRAFIDLYDAIDFRDSVDAHYPLKVTFEKVIDMREFIYDSWNGVMNMDRNPLRHIPDLSTRHMVLQILAWMWCIVFSFYVGSIVAFGISAIAHILLLAAIVITVGTFETAKRRPTFFSDFPTSTPSRARSMFFNGKRIKLDPMDKGGEHE